MDSSGYREGGGCLDSNGGQRGNDQPTQPLPFQMTDNTTELVEMMSRLCEFYSSILIQLNIILSLFNACYFFFTVENQGTIIQAIQDLQKSASTTNVGMEDVHGSVGY